MGAGRIGALPNRPSANRPPVENFYKSTNYQEFIDLHKTFDWVVKDIFSASFKLKKIKDPFQQKLHALIELVLNCNLVHVNID